MKKKASQAQFINLGSCFYWTWMYLHKKSFLYFLMYQMQTVKEHKVWNLPADIIFLMPTLQHS